MTRLSWAPLALAAVLGSACTTSLTTLQTGRALKPGEVQLQTAASVPISSALIGEIVDSAEVTADRFSNAETSGDPITEAEQRQAIEAGLAIVLFNPGVTTEIGGRVGIVDNFDVGLKYAGTLAKVDAKYQLLHQADSVDLALVGGYSYHFGFGGGVASSVYPILSFLKLDDYSRHDLEAGAIVSGEWADVFKAYASVRYLVSFVGIDADIQKVETATGAPRTELSNTLHYVVTSGGFMAGYKHVFVTAELSVAYVVAKPVILGEQRDLSGVIVAPTLGLVAKF